MIGDPTGKPPAEESPIGAREVGELYPAFTAFHAVVASAKASLAEVPWNTDSKAVLRF